MYNVRAIMDSLELGRSPESVSWLFNRETKLPSDKQLLCDWIKTDIRNANVEDRFTFCDSKLLEKFLDSDYEMTLLLKLKNEKFNEKIIFAHIHLFEQEKNNFFSSRSSVKFANIDALIQFTNPTDPSGELLINPKQQFNYVDISNKSDFGFIEYVQWRRGKLARGFAFQQDDLYRPWYKVRSTSRPESELNCQVTGINTDSMVIRSFVDFVRNHLEHGAHLVCSDATGDAPPPESRPNKYFATMEVFFNRFYMCQCIIALSTVATDGTFILKLFHTLTPFMVGLLYLVRLHFRKMTIIKPFSSRNASSEKFAIFRWKLASDCTLVLDHLLAVNDTMDKMTDTDVVELVPLNVIQADVSFVEYIVACNNRALECQTTAFHQFCNYLKTQLSPYSKQLKDDIFKLCCRTWNLDTRGDTTDPKIYLYQLIYSKNLQLDIIELTPSNADQHLRQIDVPEWGFFPCALSRTGRDPTIFLGQGANVVYTLMNGTWERVPNEKITLPPGTLIYGQLTSELICTDDDVSSSFSESLSLHIIDVYVIEFNKVYRKPIGARQKDLLHLVREENNPQVVGRPITEISSLLKYVQEARKNWKTIASKKSLLFAINNRERYYEARGLVMLAGQRNGSETGLLWDWTKNTDDVVNGRGDNLHLGRFEELLAGQRRQTDRQRNSRNIGSRGERPMIFRNPNNTFNN